MTQITGLRFEPETGYIARTPGFAVAYMSRAAHEQDPTLGHKMAAAPEMVEVIQAFIDENVDYMTINHLGDPEGQHNVKWARKVLAKAKGQ